MKTLARFLADETGATAIEYGLIAAGISVAIIATVGPCGPLLIVCRTALAAGDGRKRVARVRERT